MPEQKPPQQSNPNVSERLKTEYERFTEMKPDERPDRELPNDWVRAAKSSGSIRQAPSPVIPDLVVDAATPPVEDKPAETPEIDPEVPAEQPEEEQPSFGMAVLTANVGDQPTDQDSLGFGPYVEAITAFLTNHVTKPPLTLSIEGEWGSGKSSFMMQLEGELRKTTSRIVRFNAWRYDKDDAMWAAFALKFASDLSDQLSWIKRWLAHLKLFIRRFDWQSGWKDITRLLFMIALLATIVVLPILWWDQIVAFVFPQDAGEPKLDRVLKPLVVGGSGVVAYIALVVSLLASLKDVLGNPLKIHLKHHLNAPDYKSRVAFIERFHEDFGRVAEVYGEKEKIFVFIDDLDRCEIPRAADLMQGINLMISDSSQLIFIIGMDREKVAAGLAVKFEKLLPYVAAPRQVSSGRSKDFDPVFGLEYGYSFIEKFIQLPFSVPEAGVEQVEGFMKQLLGSNVPPVKPAKLKTLTPEPVSGRRAEEVVTDDSETLGDILKMVAPAFDYNPRRLKQFVNAFRLKTFIASRTGLFEEPTDSEQYDRLTIFQVGKFVAIGLRWPLLLADLDKRRSLLAKLEEKILTHEPVDKLVEGEDAREELRDMLERWSARPALRALLRFGREANGDWSDEATRTYRLSRTNINKLLQISPKPTLPARANGSPSSNGNEQSITES